MEPMDKLVGHLVMPLCQTPREVAVVELALAYVAKIAEGRSNYYAIERGKPKPISPSRARAANNRLAAARLAEAQLAEAA